MAIFYDCESTGLLREGIENPALQPQVIEIGAVLTRRNEVVRTYSQLINPGIGLPPEITRITGLKDEDLKDSPAFAQVLADLITLFREDEEQMFIAHNAPFDLGCLIFELRRLGMEHRFPYPFHQVDTVPLSGGKKLQVWAQELLGDKAPQQTHRALEDAQLLFNCWRAAGLS